VNGSTEVGPESKRKCRACGHFTSLHQANTSANPEPARVYALPSYGSPVVSQPFPGVAPPAARLNEAEVNERLGTLARLLESGLITDDEYEQRRAAILDSI
jgi:hypothetical protein